MFRQMSRHVEAINALGADAIVMVGDLVDDQVEDIGVIVEPISGFSAPDGQFFVPGMYTCQGILSMFIYTRVYHRCYLCYIWYFSFLQDILPSNFCGVLVFFSVRIVQKIRGLLSLV